ncbi:MAG TPA: ABC transporter permease [Candidatus Fraserbacteria bacterium]|nr:ABC transporter permease [Candidatus Fraserbacteria bacterium]
MILGALLLLLYKFNPLLAYESLFAGGFGSLYGWAESLANATPLILTALTFAVGLRGGLFNIGAEGQVYVGALAAVATGLLPVPAALRLIVTLVLALAAGALWGLVPALLKMTRGVHEVISTIMLNWIAYFFAFYLIAHTLSSPLNGSRTIRIPPAARFGVILPGTDLNYGILVSILLALLFYFLLWRTTVGFELRAVGYNPRAAHYAGMDEHSIGHWAFLLGGVSAGLAGAVQLMGRPPSYAILSGIPQLLNLGFDGIGVAMIGRNHPLGILLAAVFFGGLEAGGRTMELVAGVPLEMVRVVEGLILIALAVPELGRFLTYLRHLNPLELLSRQRRRAD